VGLSFALPILPTLSKISESLVVMGNGEWGMGNGEWGMGDLTYCFYSYFLLPMVRSFFYEFGKFERKGQAVHYPINNNKLSEYVNFYNSRVKNQ
jgi:hypothetical protein